MKDPSPWLIHRLDQNDLPGFRTLRLAALRQHPEAYGSAYEEEVNQDLPWFARFLLGPPGGAWGCFADAVMIGIACVFVQNRPKLRHQGLVASVYFEPAHRGTGASRVLLRHVITAARADGLCVLRLSVTDGNAAAETLYTSLGFRRSGMHHRGLCVNGVFHDEILMALDLD